MRMPIIAALVLLAFLMAYIRLAPSDPGLWNIDPTLATDSPGGIRLTRIYPDTPEALLTRLNALALATPRTALLAGSPESLRMTWLTRSLIMGFPDYTTAQVTQTPEGTRLDIHARLRFGRSDLSVNAARVTLWLSQL